MKSHTFFRVALVIGFLWLFSSAKSLTAQVIVMPTNRPSSERIYRGSDPRADDRSGVRRTVIDSGSEELKSLREQTIRYYLLEGYEALQSSPPDYITAEAAYKTVLDLYPKESRLISSMAYLYTLQGKYDEAIEFYQKAIKYQSKSIEAHGGLGNIYFGQERYAEALGEYQTVIKINSKMPLGHYSLVLTYLKLNKRDEALKELSILRKLDPSLAAKLEISLKE